MKTKFFTVFILSISLISSFAQSSTQIVNEVLTKSGSATMFKQIDGMLESKIAEKKSTFKTEDDFNKFASIMRLGFNSTKAEEYFNDYFEKFTNEDSLKSVIKIYNNPLMLEMTKLEEIANSPSKQQEMQNYFAGLSSNPPKQERIQSLLRLDNATGATDMTVKLLENMIFAMINGGNQTQPKDKQISKSEVENKLKSAFPENFKQQMTNQLVAVWLYTYKDVDNDKLNSYIQTWESSTGKYFSKATVSALDYTFTKMGEDFGVALGNFANSEKTKTN